MILDLYLARRTLRAMGIVLGIFGGLVVMIEMLEQIRRLSSHDAGLSVIFQMALLNSVTGIYSLLTLIVMLGTLVLFLGLARSSELVVTRASGRSALRALWPTLVTTVLFGVLCVAVVNPFAAASQREYERRVEIITGGSKAQVFSVSKAGLWLREGDDAGQMVIRATRSNTDASVLFDVSFLRFGDGGSPLFRLEAREARIAQDNWVLSGVTRWPLEGVENPAAAVESFDTYEMPTQLTPDEIRGRFAHSKAIGFWALSDFIDKLETAGFSARSYRMHFHSEVALPASLLAMVLIGASLTMRHTRLGGTTPRVLTAILLAFGFFFLRNFANVLGENGEIPILLAAWGPPLCVILGILALLLHLEDG